MKDRNKFIELNAKGNFHNWEPQKISELKQYSVSTDIGQLGYEDKLVKFWEINLPPHERLKFRLRKRSFTVTCYVKGMLISRNVSGQIILCLLEKGDSYSYSADPSELIFEIENIGDTELKFTIIEHLAHA